MRARAPSKLCLIATFLLRFLCLTLAFFAVWGVETPEATLQAPYQDGMCSIEEERCNG